MKICMVILTESSKFRQYCVAGIDCGTGKWIRLVSTDETTHGAITSEDLQFEDGQFAEPLDVINVCISGNDNNASQPENMIIDRNYYLEYVKTITIAEAVALYKDTEPRFIFGNSSYYLTEEMVPRLGRSLSLVDVKNLCFDQQINDEGKHKTKICMIL